MEVKRARSPRGPAAIDRWEAAAAAAEAAEEKKAGWRAAARRPQLVLAGFLFSLPLLVFAFGGRWPSLFSSSPLPNASVQGAKDAASTATPAASQDQKLLGGLLSSAFNESSCQSRYKSSLYRQPSPFPVSPYLKQRLRKYEAYHKRCGPKSRLYRKAIKQLNSGHNAEHSECKYVVWFPCNGLGNRMLTLTSTFLYALLTNRVLLTSVPKESENLFCEPFPGSSWALPPDFPHNQPYNWHIGSPQSYVNMLKNKVISNTGNASAGSLPAYVYLHVEQSRLRLEDNVFCEEDQAVLGKFNWMVLKSDSYFVPALFLMPMYRDELGRMFPEKESVFHHLGRYLFHPTNQVWGIIRRYYESYLANADEKLGLQIRIFPEKPITFENMYDQVVQCGRKEKLLPEIGSVDLSNTSKVKAILVTSLYPGYYEKIRAIYVENPTVTGEMVAVYQPSHEEQQKTEAQNHNQKALSEIYLLSYCDKIAISAWSTFGYVAHGFAGLKPWILQRPAWNEETANPACVQAQSVEPCLHSPPLLGCKAKKDIDPAALVPYVRHCEDVGFGLKLFSS